MTNKLYGDNHATQLYYDDPLVAAMMARDFGVELIVYPTEEQKRDYECEDPWDWKESCIDDGGYREIEMIADALSFMNEATGKAYIHPDSYSILEPKDGDKDEDGYVYSEKRKYWRKILCHTEHTREDSFTAKRDGKPFVMPKGGEDE